MASEIRVDKINSLSGVGTVTLSPTGVDISGITTASTLRATTGIITTLQVGTVSGDGSALTGIAATDNVRTGILDVAGIATFRSNSLVGSGITLSPDGDGFFTGVVTATSLSGTLPPANVSDQNNTSTGYFDLPVGTTAQRPGSPADGMIRFNSSLTQTEEYRNSAWHVLSNKATVTGGTISTAGGYNIHTFTSSGTLTINQSQSSSLLCDRNI